MNRLYWSGRFIFFVSFPTIWRVDALALIVGGGLVACVRNNHLILKRSPQAQVEVLLPIPLEFYSSASKLRYSTKTVEFLNLPLKIAELHLLKPKENKAPVYNFSGLKSGLIRVYLYHVPTVGSQPPQRMIRIIWNSMELTHNQIAHRVRNFY